jgi:phosphohistidine swiveling domain-containing protein
MNKMAAYKRKFAALLVSALFATGPQALAAELPVTETLRAWIQDMKTSERGPFARIRWFCSDGTILPPKAYACVPHGGGVQHGEWTDRIRQLRDGGYLIANILADIEVDSALARADFKDLLNQMLIEQFLIRADDGWILRKARYYRGALQEEDERAGARRLLIALCARDDWLGQSYLVLRSGARLLRHGTESGSVAEIRQLSATLAGTHVDFKALRNKIHGRPEAGDAAAVRAYADRLADQGARTEFDRLAGLLDSVYAPEKLDGVLKTLRGHVAGVESLRAHVARGIVRLERTTDAAERFAAIASLLAKLREGMAVVAEPETRLAILDSSLALEDAHFVLATSLREAAEGLSRRARLELMAASINAIYGAGLISRRQLDAARKSLDEAIEHRIALQPYKETLDYLGLLTAWAAQWQKFHFQESIRRFSEIEPLADLFTQDQLRGSPLFFYAQTIDGLIRDANAMAGISNELFGKDVGSGLRSLNPGLARGPLFLVHGEPHDLRSDGIYVLPETVADLPPVAGIVTAGEGNPLSHVQLLARNLGIPNVVVDESLIAQLKQHEGELVTLAVSPKGSVRLALDDERRQDLFGEEEPGQDLLIRPDLDKLDSKTRDIFPLSALRATDSGRIVGPKAAKLGELLHHYPNAVAGGLAIPFGVFRALLERPYRDTGQSAFQWMVGEYRRLEQMPAGSSERQSETESFRAELEAWIASATPDEDFRLRLQQTMEQHFGRDGSYGVFVRSDTNVEDLPGFTGAGLNLTVPNVVGFENVMSAISKVWASPFSARAFAWRQAHMDQPEYVFPAVLLLLSVNSDKSGVMVTKDIDSGRANWLSVAVNEGVGGAVDGQAAESLRIDLETGEVRLMAQATATYRRRPDPSGGVEKVPVSGADRVLEESEMAQLIVFAKELPQRFPEVLNAEGQAVPADIEFGFLNGELKLFQIRPFLESRQAKGNAYLTSLDQGVAGSGDQYVDLEAPPGVETP